MRAKLDASVVSDMVDGVKSANPQEEGILKVKDDGWLLMVKGPENVILFAMKVNSEAMDEYDPSGLKEFGVNFTKLDDMMTSSTGKITLETEETHTGHKIKVNQGGFAARLSLIDPQHISGHAQQAPNIDYGISATGDISLFKDFAQKVDSVIDAGSFTISPRDGAIWLYAERDAEDLAVPIHWEDFDDYKLDWDEAFSKEQTDYSQVDPVEDHAVESIFSVDFFKSISFLSDEGTIYLENEAPVKIVFDTQDDVRASYFITPRLPSDDTYISIPDEVIEERGLQ